MLISKKSAVQYAKRELGGKGFNLFLLQRHGFDVPPWVGVGQSIFSQFCEESPLKNQIIEILRSFKVAYFDVETQSSHVNFGACAREIEAVILATPLPDTIKILLEQAYAQASGKGEMIAVRSSAADEDSLTHSFAGQLSTFLYVQSIERALQSVKLCWASAFSERSLVYRRQNNLPIVFNMRVAVILQQMIDCDKAGVCFGCDPVTNNTETVVINAVYGVGEGLVSGLLNADMYSLSKAVGETLKQEIVSKESKLVFSADSETKEVAVPEEFSSKAVLDAQELQELYKTYLKIENFYNWPQDVEWGYKQGKFYILQSRPITTLKRMPIGDVLLWDNSNIVESYGGITLPLTFTFAQHVYTQVYLQICEVLHVPQSIVNHLSFYLHHMLGCLNGRVYYNLLNWYRLLEILPGSKQNQASMETMMGVGEKLPFNIAEKCKPPEGMRSFKTKLGRLTAALKLLWYHWTAESMVENFLKYFKIHYNAYRKIDYSRLSADEILSLFRELEGRLLFRWQPPIINDFLCMIHFGIFKKLNGKWLSEFGNNLQNDLLCGQGNLESAEPTRELIRMTGDVLKNADLLNLIRTVKVEDLEQALRHSPHTEFLARMERYIDNFGHRCMSELKLEQKDLHQDSSFLFVCLKNYLRTGQTSLDSLDARENEIREQAEAKVNTHLSGLKRLIFNWSLKHTRRSVRNRENLRFCRTRVYGVVRSMFYGIGEYYTRFGVLNKSEDVFYLTIDELHGSCNGTLPVHNLSGLATLRAKEYAIYALAEPAPRFLTRGPVYWLNSFDEDKAAPEPEKIEGADLVGTGCCPGIVEGVVKVILSPDDNLELNGEILVTWRTDPGWIPLYPAVSGLLVERGGLLSHSAIVAREMGLPTVVGITGLIKTLKTGMRIRMDGQRGTIEILDKAQV